MYLGNSLYSYIYLILDHINMALTKVDDFGELHVAAAAILVDAADAEAVVSLAGHAVSQHLHGRGRLCAQALTPLLRANLLPLQHVHRLGARLQVGRRLPGEHGAIGCVRVHAHPDWAWGGRMACS